MTRQTRRVLALDRALARETIAGVTETVPTYRSLLVHYDPVQIGFDALGEKLAALAATTGSAGDRVRDAGAFPWSMAANMASISRMWPKRSRPRRTTLWPAMSPAYYRVAMIGFTPGWSYLSGLEISLHMPRRQNPRLLDAGRAPFRSAACRPACNVWPGRAAGIYWGGPQSEPINCTAIRPSSGTWRPY